MLDGEGEQQWKNSVQNKCGILRPNGRGLIGCYRKHSVVFNFSRSADIHSYAAVSNLLIEFQSHFELLDA